MAKDAERFQQIGRAFVFYLADFTKKVGGGDFFRWRWRSDPIKSLLRRSCETRTDGNKVHRDTLSRRV